MSSETKPRINLFALTQEQQTLHDLLCEIGGDVTDAQVEATINEWIGEMEANEQDVLQRIGVVLKRLAGDAVTAKEEAQRLAQLAKVRENGVDRLRGRVLDYMQRQDKKRIDTPLFVFRRQRNPQPGLDIMVAPESLPEKYRRVTVEADRVAIRTALVAGVAIEGVVLTEAGEHLRVQ
jgi:hypothetical protein